VFGEILNDNLKSVIFDVSLILYLNFSFNYRSTIQLVEVRMLHRQDHSGR